ncbi:MAG TPA: hypothetical protein VFQ96_06630 [Microbacteriaceae bacterium]|nr:hypothetical protein [Microbacteriaceae bacterium]
MSGWGAGYPGMPAEAVKARRQAEAVKATQQQNAEADEEGDGRTAL